LEWLEFATEVVVLLLLFSKFFDIGLFVQYLNTTSLQTLKNNTFVSVKQLISDKNNKRLNNNKRIVSAKYF